MSLIGFHRFLIATAIVFCLGFGAWEAAAAMGGGGTWAWVRAAVSVVAAGALGYYLRHLTRFLGTGGKGGSRV